MNSVFFELSFWYAKNFLIALEIFIITISFFKKNVEVNLIIQDKDSIQILREKLLKLFQDRAKNSVMQLRVLDLLLMMGSEF